MASTLAAAASLEEPLWQHPRLYDWYFTRSPVGAVLRRREDRVVRPLIERNVADDESIIDVGCGTGRHTLAVARRARSVVALDASPAMLAHLERRARSAGIANIQPVIDRLPSVTGVAGSFAGLVAIGVLDYLAGLDDAVRALASLVTTGGWLVLTVPLGASLGAAAGLGRLSGHRTFLRTHDEVAGALAAARVTVVGEAEVSLGPAGRTLVIEARATPPALAASARR
jgi:SAM-dependent methyltransferase